MLRWKETSGSLFETLIMCLGLKEEEIDSFKTEILNNSYPENWKYFYFLRFSKRVVNEECNDKWKLAET